MPFKNGPGCCCGDNDIFLASQEIGSGTIICSGTDTLTSCGGNGPGCADYDYSAESLYNPTHAHVDDPVLPFTNGVVRRLVGASRRHCSHNWYLWDNIRNMVGCNTERYYNDGYSANGINEKGSDYVVFSGVDPIMELNIGCVKPIIGVTSGYGSRYGCYMGGSFQYHVLPSTKNAPDNFTLENGLLLYLGAPPMAASGGHIIPENKWQNIKEYLESGGVVILSQDGNQTPSAVSSTDTLNRIQPNSKNYNDFLRYIGCGIRFKVRYDGVYDDCDPIAQAAALNFGCGACKGFPHTEFWQFQNCINCPGGVPDGTLINGIPCRKYPGCLNPGRGVPDYDYNGCPENVGGVDPTKPGGYPSVCCTECVNADHPLINGSFGRKINFVGHATTNVLSISGEAKWIAKVAAKKPTIAYSLRRGY